MKNKVKKLLIIYFDLIREGESQKSLAIASILAYLKNDKRYGEEFLAEHLSIDMFGLNNQTKAKDLASNFEAIDFQSLDYVAVSAYVWNEFLTNDLMNFIRNHFGFCGDFILGGYQISYSNNPEIEYPNGKYFVSSYAEESILKILTDNIDYPKLNFPVDFNKLPSPYLTGELPIDVAQNKVRMETKRGCPYRCKFCAHRDLTFNKIYKHNLDKVFEEVSFFKKKKVQKINIIDPIFNASGQYLDIMEEFVKTNTTSLISVQARFETIIGDKFLDYCEKLNVNLEFGLQTAIEEESKFINRKNNPQKIKSVMSKLNERGIDYEVSLIYGLPTQTLDSFKYSIDFVLENGCSNISAFPLMLLKGTELYNTKNEYDFIEQNIGEYNIPVVIQSDSFTEGDWLKMKTLAENLSPTGRI